MGRLRASGGSASFQRGGLGVSSRGEELNLVERKIKPGKEKIKPKSPMIKPN
jgi:hypothetical protein